VGAKERNVLSASLWLRFRLLWCYSGPGVQWAVSPDAEWLRSSINWIEFNGCIPALGFGWPICFGAITIDINGVLAAETVVQYSLSHINGVLVVAT
jgi:hypothetical protein